MARLCFLAAFLLAACAHSAPAPAEPTPPGAQDEAAAQALWARGRAEEAAGRLGPARDAYAELALRYPLDPLADAAKRRMAALDLALRRFHDAEQALRTQVERAPAEEKPAVVRRLAEAAVEGGDFAEAVRAWVKLTKLSPDAAERSRARAEIRRIVDARLPVIDIARLLSDLPPDDPAVPILSAKRALVLAHEGAPGADVELSTFLARFPGSPAAPVAKAALDRLRSAGRVEPGLIGVLLPESPPQFAAYATAALQGIRLALGDAADRIRVADSRGDPAAAAKAVEALAAQGAQILLGPILSSEAEAAATAAQRLGIPIVTLARAEGLTNLGPYVFRNFLTDSAQARAIIEYAKRRGIQRFAFLWPDIDYGRQMMNLLWDQVDAAGGVVRGAESYPAGTTTFKTYAEKLVGRHDLELREDWIEGVRELREEKLRPLRFKRELRKLREGLPPVVDFDALFIADSARNVSLIAPQLAVENVVTNGCDAADLRRIRETTGATRIPTVELLGWTAWADPDFDLVERAGRYVECSVFVDGFFAQSARPATRAFVAAFQKAYGHPPGLMEAEAYDAARMVAQALASHPATRAQARDAFAAIQGFPGATGTTTIGPDREPQKDLFYVTITAKGYEELDLGKVVPRQGLGGS